MVGIVTELLKGGHDGDGAGARRPEDHDTHRAGADAGVGVYESAGDGVGGEREDFGVLGVVHVFD
jgi:hypothetical protein